MTCRAVTLCIHRDLAVAACASCELEADAMSVGLRDAAVMPAGASAAGRLDAAGRRRRRARGSAERPRGRRGCAGGGWVGTHAWHAQHAQQ